MSGKNILPNQSLYVKSGVKMCPLTNLKNKIVPNNYLNEIVFI